MPEGFSLGKAYVSVSPDTTGFKDKLNAELDKDKTDVRVKITPDTTDFKTRMDAALARDKTNATVGINVDSKGLKEKVDVAAKEAKATAKVNVDVNTKSAQAKLSSFADKGSEIFKPMIAAALGLGPALLPVMGVVATSTASIAASAAVAGAGLGAFGLVAKSVYTTASTAAKTVSAAQTAYNKAIDSGTSKSKAYATEQAAISKATAGMGSSQADLVKSIASMSTAWNSVLKSVTPVVSSALVPWVNDLKTAMQFLKPLITPIANEIRSLGNQVGSALGGHTQDIKNFAAAFGGDAAAKIKAFAGDIQLLWTGARALLQDAGASWKSTGDGIHGFVQSFTAWATSSKAASEIQGFLKWVHDNGPLVKKTLADLGGAAVNLVKGLGSYSGSSLSAVNDILELIGRMSPGTVQALAISYVALGSAFKGLSVASGIASGISSVSAALTAVQDAAIGTRIELGFLKAQEVIVAAYQAVVAGATAAWTAAQSALDVAMDANPIGLIIIGLVALGAAIYEVVAHWKLIITTLHATWSTVVSYLHGIWSDITNGIHVAWSAITNWLHSTWSKSINQLHSLWSGAVNFLHGIWSSISNGIHSAWSAVTNWLHSLWNNSVNTLKNVWNGARNWLRSLWNGFSNDVRNVWNSIKGWLGSLWNNTVSGMKNIWNGARNWLHSLWNGFQNDVKSVWNSITNWLHSAWSNSVNALKNAWNGARSWLRGIWGDIKNDAAAGWRAIATAIGSAFNTVKNAVGKPISWVVDNVSKGVDAVTSKLGAGRPMGSFEHYSLAGGGVIPGYAPGRDIVHGVDLSPGEGVLVPEAVKAIGPNTVRAINARYSNRAPGDGTGRFAGGGIWGDIEGLGSDVWNDAKTAVGAIANPLSAVKKMVSAIIGEVPGSGVGVSIAEGAGKLILSNLAKMFSFATTVKYNASAGVAQWKSTVLEALKLNGEPASLLNQVLKQISTESGGNPNAVNNTDINAQEGHPSQGLLQTIPSTFEAYHVKGTSNNIRDPLANIAAAINYAKHVYGPSLMSGGSGLGSGHGYASGGSVPAGDTAWVGENGKELVSFGAAARVTPNSQVGGNTFNITITGAMPTDGQIGTLKRQLATVTAGYNI